MEDKNLIFDIFNEDGTSFNGLSLKKSTFSTVIMSLDDKIEGDIYYKDNDLSFTFKEYIVYKGIKFSLRIDQPPTILKKGILEDNNELKGMTKYSLTFYHPMSILYNIPFTDVAVSSDESKYKSQDTTFYWIGTLTDFVTKINKNLQGTLFTCAMQAGFVDNGTKSDVIQFQDQKISDVLKTAYETWKVPYVVDGYNILFGKPSNEIYAEGSSTPFVFKMGQGLGFKNGDRTPKNNTVVTRIAGFGSATNIPNGYPIIQWSGEQSWKFTINNDSTAINSYPIIDSIIDGVSVKVIDHPFTRKTLMPSIYVDSVNKKVNPFATGYNKDIELIDYYDAVDDESHVYTNHINVTSPSYYKKGFDGSDKAVPDIKPTIVGAKYNNQAIDVIKSISWVNDDQTEAVGIDDTYDAQTDKYTQGYFKIEFYPLGFDLYAMASVTSAMSVNMTSGACNGCKFELAVDWDIVKTNFYYTDANNVIIFDPTNIHGIHRDYNIFPDSTNQSISVIVKKDINTFGTLMPNIYQQPKANDTFMFTGIAMPSSYIIYAQSLLDEAMKQYMKENNIAYYEYPIDFDNYFLETNTNILNQIKTNSIIRFDYANFTFALSVKDLSISWGSAALPSYKITLTDDIAIVTNPLGTVVDGLSKLGTQVAQLQTSYNINIIDELNNKLSKKYDDVAAGKITFKKGLESIGLAIFKDGAQFGTFTKSLYAGTGAGVDEKGNGEFESIRVRSYFEAVEFIVNRLSAIEGDQLLTEADTIESVDDLGNGCYGLHLRSKWDGYFTAQAVNNVLKGIINTLSAGSGTYYTSWFRVNSVNTANNYIEVTVYPDVETPAGKNYPPSAMMKIARWGNQTDTTRQSCLYLSSTEGRIVKLVNVTKPIIDKTNYGVVIGEIPDFLKSMSLPLRADRDYVYAPGIITTDVIRIDYQGKPMPTIIDRGLYIQGSEFYAGDTVNPTTGIYEISDVWYNGCKYRCQKTGTITAPAWNNTDWAMVEGNPYFTVDFAESENILDPDNFYATLSIVAKLYNIDVTGDILDSDVSWTRYSQDADGIERTASDSAWALKRANSGKSIVLTIADCDINGYMPKKICFIATVTLRDGMTAYVQSISYEY